MTVRELHGWSPRTVTLDAAGALVSVSVVEPRFTRQETAILLAARRAAMAPRGEHGILLSEAMAKSNQFAYEGFGPQTDWAEIAIKAKIKQYLAEHPDADMTGKRFGVRKRGD